MSCNYNTVIQTTPRAYVNSDSDFRSRYRDNVGASGSADDEGFEQ